MPWEIHHRKGVWLPQVGWWLDAQARAERAFVSHAHSDHIARHKEVLCTAVTARLLHARLPGRRAETVLPFGRRHALEFGLHATLYPAGHIFGSSQILLEHEDHGSLLYTGDFKLRTGYSTETCATPNADVLIMETTFGLPRYVFPPQEEIVDGMIQFCHRALADCCTPVFFCYSLGKSQEVLRALASAKLPVMLHSETLRLTRICEQHGLEFPTYREFDADEVAGHIVICPPFANGLIDRIPSPRTASVTGWALDSGATYRLRTDAAFPLSDHAGFDDLLTFVERVRPKRIFTLHGFAREFAQTLRERGWDALAIGQGNQLEFRMSG
ncbi:MAG: fold metallo-hydrolase [Verrucomicrobia bacterium]|nr:fold metallo-hydrolase [Verrucomicrobiota bacterium]